jgi:hypothetical protein
MLFSIRASSLAAALIIAAPALAQQTPSSTGQASAKHMAQSGKTFAWGGALPTGYQKTCGTRFVCYTGIPLDCTPDTRPYQDIANHACYCLRDGCPR